MPVISNIGVVLRSIAESLQKIRDKEYFLRPVAVETIKNMKQRIHIEGKGSNGAQIGTYSNGYMQKRKENQRDNSRKVIVSLTRELENDWIVRATYKGYGIGFNNEWNFKKMGYVEEIKKTTIAHLTTEEKTYVTERLQELLDNAFNT